MAFRSIIALLGAAGVVSAAACSKSTGCRADNCLRAVRATQHPTHILQASADCSSLLDITVTPSTVTITQFSTVQATDTITVPTTLVETVHETLTSGVVETVTVGDTITVTVPLPSPTLKPREGAVTDGLPSYATACSSLARFASACACIGVTANMISAPAPSTTVIVTVTETNTAFVTQAIETASVTVDDTIFQTTTATVTSDVVVTVTATPAVVGAPEGISDGSSLGYFSYYFSMGYYQVSLGEQTSTVTLQPNGQLMYGNYVAMGEPIVEPYQPLSFLDPTTANSYYMPFTCALDASNYLSCYLSSPATPLIFGEDNLGNVYIGTPQGFSGFPWPIFQVQLGPTKKK